MRSLGVHRLYVLDDQDPFEIPLADIVADYAEQAGITVPAHDSLSTSTGSGVHGRGRKDRGTATRRRCSSRAGKAKARRNCGGPAQAPTASAAARVEHDGRANRSPRRSATAAANTYLTTPVLPDAALPAARAAGAAPTTAATFGAEGGPYALYGYEAMTLVLDAVRASGARGNDRQTVIDRVFAVRNRNSVIGRYSIEADGETTLSRYGGRPRQSTAVRSSTARSTSARPTRRRDPAQPLGGCRPTTRRKRCTPPPSSCPPPASVVAARRYGTNLEIDGRFGQPDAFEQARAAWGS